jgi:hypothetical protein
MPLVEWTEYAFFSESRSFAVRVSLHGTFCCGAEQTRDRKYGDPGTGNPV